jgi:CRP-like cAMP-binding protein
MGPRLPHALADAGQPFCLPHGLLARAGESVKGLYFIGSGFVELSTGDRRGHRVLVQTFGPGEVVGCCCMVPPYLWQFDVCTAGPVTGTLYDAQSLRDFCEKERDVGYELFRFLCGVLANRLSATRTTAAGCVW